MSLKMKCHSDLNVTQIVKLEDQIYRNGWKSLVLEYCICRSNFDLVFLTPCLWGKFILAWNLLWNKCLFPCLFRHYNDVKWKLVKSSKHFIYFVIHICMYSTFWPQSAASKKSFDCMSLQLRPGSRLLPSFAAKSQS